MSAPICPAFEAEAVLCLGADSCPDRQDLADAPVWACVVCPDTYAECRPGTETPIGGLADPALREVRTILLGRRIDPLWRDTNHQVLARGRVYRFLAHVMELAEMEPAAFTLKECRAAWVALQGVTYADVRAWATTDRGPAQAKKARAA